VNWRRLNWALVVVPFVAALVATALLAAWAASGDQDRFRTALPVMAAVILPATAVCYLGVWRVYKEYTRSKKFW
jgi:hypothetical protein